MITISIPSNWNKNCTDEMAAKKSCKRFFSREKKMLEALYVIADVDGGGYNLLPWRLLHCLFMDAFSLWTIDEKKTRELLIFPRQTMKYSNLSVNVEKMWNRWYGWCERCKRMKVRAKSAHQSFTLPLSLSPPHTPLCLYAGPNKCMSRVLDYISHFFSSVFVDIFRLWCDYALYLCLPLYALYRNNSLMFVVSSL